MSIQNALDTHPLGLFSYHTLKQLRQEQQLLDATMLKFPLPPPFATSPGNIRLCEERGQRSWGAGGSDFHAGSRARVLSLEDDLGFSNVDSGINSCGGDMHQGSQAMSVGYWFYYYMY